MRISIDPYLTLTGHQGAIYKIIEGNQPGSIISAGGDGWVAHWQPELTVDGKLLARENDNIFCMTRMPDSDIFLGTMQGNLIRITTKDEDTRKIHHHNKGVYDISTYQNTLFTLGGDGIITRWGIDNLLPKDSIKLSHKPLRKIAFHPSEPIAAIASSDHKIYLLDIEKFQLIKETVAHQRSVFSLVFHPSGQRLFSGSMDAHLGVWDYPFMKNTHLIPAHLFTINDLVYIEELDLLFSASRDKNIKIWEGSTLELIKVIDRKHFDAHLNSVNTLFWDREKQILYSGSDDRTIRGWKILT